MKKEWGYKMNRDDKKGKFFLITSVAIFVASLYISLNGFHNDILTGVKWFILLGILFISVVNILKNRKKENSYYSIGNLIIAVTVVGCYIVPQLIRYIFI